MISWDWVDASTPRNTSFNVRRDSKTGDIELVISHIGNEFGGVEPEILKTTLEYYAKQAKLTHSKFTVIVQGDSIDVSIFEIKGISFVKVKKDRSEENKITIFRCKT